MFDVVPKPAPVRIEAETPADAAAVEALVLAAFGPGRFAKTAERLRERSSVAAAFVARDEGRPIGSVRLWRITIGETPALFLGPIAVAPDSRKAGLGADLVQACVDHAASLGVGILLVGDVGYFERFGFAVAPDVRLSGPVDRARLLWRGEGEPAGLARAVSQG
ncbi:GNAT family N-acetyltransferase [Brevundimonas sp.]|uniref:GNAT family N-acetyltransferase n=1 Tax=Brevundimonas sp. TaxID=1871086 RepID=UPI00273791A9|nr:N-acetyltransferase [Brevundimonas sp.]